MTDVVAPCAPESPLQGRSILVTGGAGAFGKAFVQRCLSDGARRVVVFSRSESRQAEMKAVMDDPRLRLFLGDVRDEDRLVQAMRGVDLVVHAAAQKRIETCQNDPGEAMKTNIVGTYNVAQAAITCGVERAIFLSTDKSAAPATVYGASKLFGEGLWCAMNALAAGTRTTFAATRYGNVAGSTGSVIPIWRAQSALKLPLTITDRRCTRFLMSMAQAVDLVCLAVREMKGAEVFVPQIRGARMVDLATAIDPSATLQDIGVRGAEKLHETLISEDEVPYTSQGKGFFVIEAEPRHGGRVWPGFTYRSNDGALLSVDELRALVAA